MIMEDKKIFLINFCYIGVISALIFLSVRFAFQYLFPFILAAVIAAVMQKPAAFLSRKIGLNEELCAVILFLGFFIIAISLILFLIYQSVTAISSLVPDIPKYLNKLSGWFGILGENFNNLFGELPDEMNKEMISVVREAAENLAIKLSAAFSSFAANTAKKMPSFLFSSLVTIVAGCYIAKDYKRLKKFVFGLFNKKVYVNSVRIKNIFIRSVLKIARGYIFLSLLTFLELLIGFFVLGLKYAFVLALSVALVDLLPVLGAGTVLIPWGLILIATGNKSTGFGLLIIYVLTLVVRNFSEPKIIGKQVGINPFFTLIAMFTGLKLMGFFGLILLPILLIVVIEFYKNDNQTEFR